MLSFVPDIATHTKLSLRNALKRKKMSKNDILFLAENDHQLLEKQVCEKSFRNFLKTAKKSVRNILNTLCKTAHHKTSASIVYNWRQIFHLRFHSVYLSIAYLFDQSQVRLKLGRSKEVTALEMKQST